MNRLLTLAATLTVPIALTACGGSSSTPSAHDTPSAPPSSSAPPSPSPTATSGGTDQQRVTAIQLALTDLPSGWKSQPDTTTAAERLKNDRQFDTCLGLPTIETIQTTSSEVDFGRGDGFAFAATLINVTKNEPQAAPYQAVLAGPKGVSCSVASARSQPPPKGAKLVSATGSRLDAPAGEFAMRTVVTYKLANGRNVSLTIDDFGMVVKRFIVQVAFTGVIQPPQKALEDSVVAKVLARATANAA
ncbi:MAG: hypothetical protein QOD07_289 [Frankiaceae bacterium]|jgi:hypothetical protein|nr:hypothetical protein [Frankiaceae bacterium]